MLEKTRTKLESMFNTEKQLGLDGISYELDGLTKVSFSQGNLLAALHNSIRPSLSIEIGLAYGYSALFILDSMFENNYGKHVAIDPYEVTAYHGIGLNAIHDLEFDDRFEWREAKSIDALRTMRRDGVRAQYIYMDGHHTFDAALIDFSCSDEILDTGGVIIFDDMWMPSIKTLVSFIKNNVQSYEHVDVDCGSISCFKKTGEDIRSWNHFVRFDTSYDVPSIYLADKTTSPPFSLPLVSVIVVNYNYGRFLREAVDSVFAQTYPNIECIVVDNASTDESVDVLQDIATQYPGAKILRRKENGGQSLALMEGFAASAGEYAVFLDADDYLLAAFVETHVFVHLSLRIQVGFSSSDMIQAIDSRMALGTYGPVSEFVRSGRGKSPGLLRRMDESAPGVWPLPSPGVSIETQVHFVGPRNAGDWMWAPTSGNCFRRDALLLFLNNEDLAALRHCTDAYLLRGINVVTGSVVIDRPLAVYRLHGTNAFSKNLHLNGVLNYDRNSPSDHNQLGHKLIMDHLIANARLFLGKMPSPWHYVDALQALNDCWPQLPSTVPGCGSYLAGRVVTEARALAPALGYREFINLLERLNVAPNVLLKARLWLNRNKERRS